MKRFNCLLPGVLIEAPDGNLIKMDTFVREMASVHFTYAKTIKKWKLIFTGTVAFLVLVITALIGCLSWM